MTGTKEVLVARLREGDESETQRSPGRKETSPTKRAPSPVRMTRKPSTVSHYLGQGSRWFREPVTIIKYFGLYLGDLGRNALRWGRERSSWIAILCLLAGIMYLLLLKEGQHQVLLKTLHLQMIWYAWWGLLGIASSIGLGTGLHTFMLFLGPFISQSTMTAYKCGSLDFATRGANR